MSVSDLREAFGYMTTLPCGDATPPPLIQDLESKGIFADESLRYGDISVINAQHPTDTANRLLVEVDQGFAIIVREGPGKHEVTDERITTPTVVVKGQIAHLVDGEPGEFHGWFIAEEFVGGDYDRHPFLLLTPAQVREPATASTE